MNSNTNSLTKITQGAGMGGGVATLVSAQDDIIKLVGLIVAIISLGWSIYERFANRKGAGPAVDLFLVCTLSAALGLLAVGCGIFSGPRTLDPAGPYQGDAILWAADGLIVEVRDAYGTVQNLAARNPDVVAHSAALSQLLLRVERELDGRYEPDEVLPNLVKYRDAYAAIPVETNAAPLQAQVSIARVLLDQTRDLIPALLAPQPE
jgi:hypothetical protein